MVDFSRFFVFFDFPISAPFKTAKFYNFLIFLVLDSDFSSIDWIFYLTRCLFFYKYFLSLSSISLINEEEDTSDSRSCCPERILEIISYLVLKVLIWYPKSLLCLLFLPAFTFFSCWQSCLHLWVWIFFYMSFNKNFAFFNLALRKSPILPVLVVLLDADWEIRCVWFSWLWWFSWIWPTSSSWSK